MQACNQSITWQLEFHTSYKNMNLGILFRNCQNLTSSGI